jgi:hypothetical protein
MHAAEDLCEAVLNHAPYWPKLPLKHLAIDAAIYYYVEQHPMHGGNSMTKLKRPIGCPLDHTVLPDLQKLTGLTYLGLQCNLPSKAGFGAALAQLTGLQELRLACKFEQRSGAGRVRDVWHILDYTPDGALQDSHWVQEFRGDLQELMCGVAQLSQLKRLALKRLCGCLTCDAAEELANAPQLQRVELWEASSVSVAEIKAILGAGVCRGCVVVEMPEQEGQKLEV